MAPFEPIKRREDVDFCRCLAELRRLLPTRSLDVYERISRLRVVESRLLKVQVSES